MRVTTMRNICRKMLGPGVSAALSVGLSMASPAARADGPLEMLAAAFGRQDATENNVSATEGAWRAIEIEIELAWMADPATFPYHLQARAKGNRLELRGTVPSRRIHTQALNIAKLRCAMPTIDAIQENPRVAVQAVRLPAGQMQSTAQTALREALPRQAKNLRVQCTADGAAQLTGEVLNAEQKLAASKALRRLHGCT